MQIASFLALHLVAAEVVVAEVFEPLAELVAGDAVGDVGGELGVLQDLVIDEDGTIDPESKGEGVGGARVNADDLASAVEPDNGVERILAEFGDNDFVDLGVEADQYVLNEVVGHGTRRG